MALSLKDIKFDNILKTQLRFESLESNETHCALFCIAPSAPRLSEIMDANPVFKYPSMENYMGLEFTNEVITANVPEFFEDSKNLAPKTNLRTVSEPNKIIAPLSSEVLARRGTFVINGVRQITLCKDVNGKVGLRVQSVKNGIFINLVKKNSPAAMAGVRFGDQILEINEKSVSGLSTTAVHDIIKKSPGLKVLFNIRDRPFERTITLEKDSTGHVGFSFKNGKVVSLVIDSSAAENGLLTNHNLMEVNEQSVVGLKDKEISKIFSEGECPHVY